MKVVIALGGNALLRRGQSMGVDTQRGNVREAAGSVAAVAREHQVVLTHGNGPQVGLLALQNEAYAAVPPYPLDVLDAESEGMIGYLLEQELGRHLDRDRLVTLLTQVRVDPSDPAFDRPTKFVGPVYDERRARELSKTHGWSIAPDGNRWRRVVASPDPCEIIEVDTIRRLVDAGVTVICAGGGGIPVVDDGHGGLRGVEAVIDKDLSAALLATALDADALMLLTDVDAVHVGWGTSSARPLGQTTAHELRALQLPAGSMGPKAEAVCRFVDAGGRLGAIGSLGSAMEMLAGRAGTVVRGGDRRQT